MNGNDIAFKYVRPIGVTLWARFQTRGILKGRGFHGALWEIEMNGDQIELNGHYAGCDLFGGFAEDLDLVVAWHLKRGEFPGAL